jgi:uncharacterized protein YkwD
MDFKMAPTGSRNIIRSPTMSRWILVTFQLAALCTSLCAPLRPKLEPVDPDKLSESERERASALFQQLKTHPDDPAQRTRIISQIAGIGRASAKKMFGLLDRQLQPLWNDYRQFFNAAARKVAASKANGAARQEILRLEREVRSLRELGDRLTKDQIRQTGDPAMERLRQLKFLTRKEILAASPGLNKKRLEIIEFGKQRSICMEQLILLEAEAAPFGLEHISAFEENTARSALGIPGDYLATLRYNTKLASTIPFAEAEAIRDMNHYRMLIGLPPCVIDPRLCKAARDHSRDMHEKDFFSHTSPVAGKKSPWMRAKLEGTTAKSENIYSGRRDGKAANRSWWYSPGHHRNMLNPKNRRVGMGVHEKDWTQMFGN